MKHRKGIIITIIITAIICFVAVPLGVNYAFHHVAPVDMLAARWEASDALNYITTTLAFIGTFFLGFGCVETKYRFAKNRNKYVYCK